MTDSNDLRVLFLLPPKRLCNSTERRALERTRRLRDEIARGDRYPGVQLIGPKRDGTDPAKWSYWLRQCEGKADVVIADAHGGYVHEDRSSLDVREYAIGLDTLKHNWRPMLELVKEADHHRPVHPLVVLGACYAGAYLDVFSRYFARGARIVASKYQVPDTDVERVFRPIIDYLRNGGRPDAWSLQRAGRRWETNKAIPEDHKRGDEVLRLPVQDRWTVTVAQ